MPYVLCRLQRQLHFAGTCGTAFRPRSRWNNCIFICPCYIIYSLLLNFLLSDLLHTQLKPLFYFVPAVNPGSDLKLARQLQQEEEQRRRQEEAQREREEFKKLQVRTVHCRTPTVQTTSL